jgi:thiol-disulfide isomerase/thioredoxin
VATIALTRDRFEQVINVVIVNFRAPWFRSCRAFAPTFEKSSDRHASVP